MKRAILVLTAALALSSPVFAASIVYSNTTTDTGDTLSYSANGYTEMGDQIHLSGTNRTATQAVVQFFNSGLGGTFDTTLRFFNLGAPVGSQIGPSFALIGVTAGASTSFNVNFTALNLVVPTDLIFTVSIANQSAGVVIEGLNMFEPPTIGSSSSLFAIARDSGGYLQAGTTAENVFFELQADPSTAVPEPNPLMLTLLAFPALALARNRLRQM